MAGTAAWIDVLPNLSAFGTKLNSGVTARGHLRRTECRQEILRRHESGRWP